MICDGDYIDRLRIAHQAQLMCVLDLEVDLWTGRDLRTNEVSDYSHDRFPG